MFGHRSRFDWVVAAVAALLGVGSIAAAFRLGIGTTSEPGPGAWPLVIGIAMLVVDVWFVLRPEALEKDPIVLPSRWGRFAVALASLFGYVLLLDPLGYLIATALLLFVQLRWVEGRSLKVSLITSLIAVIVSFVAFVYLLKVPLPPGIIPLGDLP